MAPKAACPRPQVLLYPCMQLLEGETPKATEEEFVEWKELRSPRCAGAPGVRVTCRRKTEGYADVQYACALRGPQRGGALSSAAYRWPSSSELFRNLTKTLYSTLTCNENPKVPPVFPRP